MKPLFILILLTIVFLCAPRTVFSQEVLAANSVQRTAAAAPAVEFTSTSNASQAGVSLVLGYQFTVRTPIVVTSLGAVLQGSSTPFFGALPVSMPVALWDEDQNRLISATVSASDPASGHFHYKEVPKTLLLPGVAYTIAGLVSPGSSVLSDVPEMSPGSAIAFQGARSIASKGLAFPETDSIGLRRNYFGASFTYTGGRAPVALAGRDRTVRTGALVHLDGSQSFGESGAISSWHWTWASKPAGSQAEISAADSSHPSFIADIPGVYVARLEISDGLVKSEASTVSIVATERQR